MTNFSVLFLCCCLVLSVLSTPTPYTDGTQPGLNTCSGQIYELVKPAVLRFPQSGGVALSINKKKISKIELGKTIFNRKKILRKGSNPPSTPVNTDIEILMSCTYECDGQCQIPRFKVSVSEQQEQYLK